MLRPIVLGLLVLLSVSNPAFARDEGRLVSADPVVETPPGMQAWRIRYRTTDENGRSSEVTGMVVAPREAQPARPREVIAWAHGTWGVVEKCAPSLSPDFFTATPALEAMIRRGYLVVAPDYAGLGTPQAHPYLLGVETARSVLDAIRAAQAIPGAAAGNRFAVWGESQGGHAALWTAAEAARYAPDLTLVATAAAAPPTDLPANLRSGSDANVRAMLTAFAAYSWSRRYGYPLSSLFGPANAGIATRLARNNCISLDKKPRLGTILGVAAIRKALVRKDMASIAPWSRVAKANSVAPHAVPGPLLIAQSEADPVVAPAVTLAYARQRCKATGLPLRYVRLPGGNHGASARDSGEVTLDWIAARFAGAKPPTDCGRL